MDLLHKPSFPGAPDVISGVHPIYAMGKGSLRIVKTVITYFIIIVIFIFLFTILRRNWTEILAYSYSISYIFLLFSAVIFALLNIVVHASAWRRIVLFIIPDNHLSRRKFFEIYVYSWFGKYIPGKFMMPLGKVYLGSREGLSAKNLALSSFFELALAGVSMLFASIISLVFLALYVDSLKPIYIFIAFVLALAAFTMLHPAILSKLLNLALRSTKKGEIDKINLFRKWPDDENDYLLSDFNFVREFVLRILRDFLQELGQAVTAYGMF